MKIIQPKPLGKPYFTPGTYILIAISAIGFSFGLVRLLIGLEAVTNLSNNYPWGLWIAIDVACGVALAAGGFTTAALVDIFGGKKYKPFLRPAVLTAWLGYLMVAIGLMFDLGRYWNIWQPVFHWQGNSVMFELAMCVMAYLIVLTFEIFPSILEGLKDRIKQKEWGWSVLTRVETPIKAVHNWIKTILPIFIIAGVVLSCMHQSSLGTLMVIAGAKLNPLWQTPWLPVLFLLSAIMVGFPMVIIEAISSSKTLKQKTEMDLLEPLAAKIPWFIAIYSLFKFTDLLVRIEQLSLFDNPPATISMTIELIVGLIIPFVLLTIKPVRRSKGWLLTSCLLVVFGVVINRLNVFLIGYQPIYAKGLYTPALGEISVTVGLICTLILLYRFFVIYFPILPVQTAITNNTKAVSSDGATTNGTVPLRIAWMFRGSAILFLLAFIFLYVFVHKKGIADARQTYGELPVTMVKQNITNKKAAYTHLFRPDEYRNFYYLSSPLLNTKTNYYEPVRFSHRTHDNQVKGNCAACHHRVSDDSTDRVGEDLKEMHASIEIRIGGPCRTCHEDLNEKQFQKCSACHRFSNEFDHPARIGLKGAYHRQCVGCHIKEPASANAPTECNSCHHRLIPDHSDMFKQTQPLQALEITALCLECHPTSGEDIIKTAHWNWKGLTPCILGHEHSINTGLTRIIDNYTITMLPSLIETGSFHIGYSPQGLPVDLSSPAQIDCLICHESSGTYNKDKNCSGMPANNVDLVAVAKTVSRPTRKNCGKCHFYEGGGANLKHGDLEPVLANPQPEQDIHMGMADMRCQDCHTVSKHKVAGMSFCAPVTEGRTTCYQCHGKQPHAISGPLGRHLNDHIKAVSCETCHIPFFAREIPTRLSTDFSIAGQDRLIETDALGMPTYDKKWGGMTWGKMVLPVYRWFDGTRKSHLLGDKISPDSVVELNAPMGEKHIPESRIFPYKIHTAIQPWDTKNRYLTAVKFKDGFWNHFNWDKAIQEGMETVKLLYSGNFGFIKTRMYSSIHHGVMPAKQALGCADCHTVEAVTCQRCHKKIQSSDATLPTRQVYPWIKKRMNFKELGYEEDPAQIGGRF